MRLVNLCRVSISHADRHCTHHEPRDHRTRTCVVRLAFANLPKASRHEIGANRVTRPQGCAMLDDRIRLLVLAALLAASLLAAWVAWACRRAQQRGLSGSDALVLVGLAAVFLLYSLARLARGLGWLRGLGDWLRTLARQHGLYEDRRAFQIVATVGVALIVVALFLYGLIWIWHHIKRYRLSICFAAFAL